MFVRFISKEINTSSNVEKGIFKLAYELTEEGLLSKDEVIYLTDLLAWFKENLPIPTNFGSSINGDDATSKGICWFRASSNTVLAEFGS
jgi:hypothetical protein